MSMQNLLNQFLGSTRTQIAQDGAAQTLKSKLSNMTGQIPGGLVGGAAAGGVLALLVSNKSARKFAGTAATYGGAALLGGLAYKAYKNWQHATPSTPVAAPESEPALSPDYQLLLVKAMVAAARADGHIDQQEQERIFAAIQQMDISTEMKGLIFDLLQQPVSLDELAGADLSMEQKSELYLASCLIIDADNWQERAHLNRLASTLRLPIELAMQLQSQARTAVAQAA